LSLIFLLVSAISAQNDSRLLIGLRIVVINNPASTEVKVSLRVHSGSAFDTAGKEGTIAVLTSLLFPNPEIKEFFRDDLGGSLSWMSDYDRIQIDATARPEKFIDLMESLSLAITNPQINKESVDKVKTVLLEGVRNTQSAPGVSVNELSARLLVPGHPYARPSSGSEQSLSRIDFADIMQAEERFFTADNATLVIDGPVKVDESLRIAKRLFGSWIKSDRKVPPTFAQPNPPTAALVSETSPHVPVGRYAIRIGMRSPAIIDTEFLAHEAMSIIALNRTKKLGIENIVSASAGRRLPGILILGGDVDESRKALAENLPSQIFGEEVSIAEFTAAQSSLIKRLSEQSKASQLLDQDTFGFTKADGLAERAAKLTLGNLETYRKKILSQPFLRLIVSSREQAPVTER
ncbi:MAG: M16 family metallopeptidase, partial [Acidobacteriota bacterium]